MKTPPTYEQWLKKERLEDFIIKSAHSTRNNKVMRKSTIECINHFSKGKNICNCCGEDNILFLTISHKNNDGWVHRKMVHGSLSDYLVKNNFKTKFEIVIECYNCNLSRERNGGKCPHG